MKHKLVDGISTGKEKKVRNRWLSIARGLGGRKKGKKIGIGKSLSVLSGWKWMVTISHFKRGWDPGMGEWGWGSHGGSGAALHPPVPLAARHLPWRSVSCLDGPAHLCLCHLCLLYPAHLGLPRTAFRPMLAPCPCAPEQTEELWGWEWAKEQSKWRALVSVSLLMDGSMNERTLL